MSNSCIILSVRERKATIHRKTIDTFTQLLKILEIRYIRAEENNNQSQLCKKWTGRRRISFISNQLIMAHFDLIFDS